LTAKIPTPVTVHVYCPVTVQFSFSIKLQPKQKCFDISFTHLYCVCPIQWYSVGTNKVANMSQF